MTDEFETPAQRTRKLKMIQEVKTAADRRRLLVAMRGLTDAMLAPLPEA